MTKPSFYVILARSILETVSGGSERNPGSSTFRGEEMSQKNLITVGGTYCTSDEDVERALSMRKDRDRQIAQPSTRYVMTGSSSVSSRPNRKKKVRR